MPNTKTAEAIVLAGGLGSRLRGAIGDIPKPMAPIAGRPFLDWQLDALARRGIREAILSVGYRSEVIEAHFGDAYGAMRIRYSRETAPLGTGGAIVAAMRLVEGRAAFILNGDTFIRAPLHELESRDQCELCVLATRVDDAARFGTVKVSEGRIVGFREKGAAGPGLVNCGVYWVAKAALEADPLPERFSFEADFFEPRAALGRFCAVVTDEPFVDIGVPNSLAAAAEAIPVLASRDRA